MTTPTTIRIEIREVQDRPAPYHWELFRAADTQPFLVSRGSFRTARAAYADAQAVLDRHRQGKTKPR